MTDQAPTPDNDTATGPDAAAADQPAAEPDGPDTFPREYVQRLRDEAARHRVRAHDRDTLADRLLVALAAADGRLADPDDLPRTAQLLADPTPNAVSAEIDGPLARKPHLASRRPHGDAGQGPRPDEPGVSLLGLLRGA